MSWRHRRYLKYFLLLLILLFVVHKIFSYIQITQHTSSNYHLNDTEIQKLLDFAEKDNDARLAHSQKICRAYKFGKYKSSNTNSWSAYKEPLPHYEVFYYDVRNKLSWCPIYKAASTTWLYHFAALGGATEEQIKNSRLQISTFVRKLYKPLNVTDAIEFLSSSLKFFIVRHPFERILSAYRDKLESVATRTDSGTYFYYRKYGNRIVSKYRKGGNSTHTKSILKKGQFLWDGEKEPEGIEPTFKEFVRYLIDTNLILKADDHWIPFYVFCTPCAIEYDVLGKVETMFRDQLFIIHKSGIQNQVKPRWRHKTNPLEAPSRDKMSKIAKIYFSQLNAADVEELYEKYKIDFELFQYNASEYIDYVSKLSL